MLNDSRLDIYDYLRSVFEDRVSVNIYDMNVPQELTKSDANDGFVVLRVGNIYDRSEFPREAYAWVRCYVEAYVPPISRGRVNKDIYRNFEDAINIGIREANQYTTNEAYMIREESTLSMESVEISNANNAYYVFAKSFIVDLFQDPYSNN